MAATGAAMLGPRLLRASGLETELDQVRQAATGGGGRVALYLPAGAYVVAFVGGQEIPILDAARERAGAFTTGMPVPAAGSLLVAYMLGKRGLEQEAAMAIDLPVFGAGRAFTSPTGIDGCVAKLGEQYGFVAARQGTNLFTVTREAGSVYLA